MELSPDTSTVNFFKFLVKHKDLADEYVHIMSIIFRDYSYFIPELGTHINSGCRKNGEVADLGYCRRGEVSLSN